MKLLIIGGHHSSALPLINKIRNERSDIELFWVGHKHSLKRDKNDTLEYKEITSLGIPFYDLRAGKVYRTFNPLRLAQVPFGFFQAAKYLLQIKPDVILSFGGYLAVPVVVSGWFMGIPSVSHEQTAVVGYANRVISLFAKKILISSRASEKFFPPQKTVFTGIPLRESIYYSRSNNFGSDNTLPYILILAGKSGSVVINRNVGTALSELLMYCNVIHQCGDYSVENSFDLLSAHYAKIKNALPGRYFLRKFILEDEIGEAYGRAAIVVGRSGAHVVNEILALEKPALLIPIPWVSHNEQNQNALVVKNAGLGEILLEKQLSPESLAERIKYMLHNLNSYHNHTASNYREISKNAAGLILNETIKYASKN